MKNITVTIDPRKLIGIWEDHGGYKSGYCLCCGSGGWLDDDNVGFSFGSNTNGTMLIHKKDCQLGKFLKCQRNTK